MVLRAGRREAVPSISVRPDELLYRSFRDSGDEDALAELVEKHWAPVFRLALAIVRDPGVAEDVAQEACVRVVEAARARKELDPFAAWLRTVVLNGARNAMKIGARRARHEAEAGARRHEAVSVAPDPSSALAERLEALPEALRAPLALHFGAGLTHTEIGAVLGCPKGTAASRIRLGLERLRAGAAAAGVALSVEALGLQLAAISPASSAPVPPSPRVATLLARAPRTRTPSSSSVGRLARAVSPLRGLALAVATLVTAGGAIAILFTALGSEPLAPSASDAPVATRSASVEVARVHAANPLAAVASSAAADAPVSHAPPTLEGRKDLGRLHIAVVNEAGTPFKGATVSFESYPRVIPIFEVVTNASGAFSVPLPAASYHVSVRAPGRAEASDDIHVFAGSERAFDEPFELAPCGEIEGAIVSDDGSPIAGAGVRVRIPYGEAFTRTRPDGSFLLPGIPIGSYAVVASARLHFSGSSSAEVKVGKTTHVSMTLDRGGEVTGRVATAEGRAVPNAEISFLGGGGTVNSDDEGRFASPLLKPGEYVVHIRSESGNLGVLGQALALPGRTMPADFVLGETVDFTCRLVDALGAPAADRTVCLRGSISTAIAYGTTGDSGTFTFGHVPPGSYVLEVRGAGGMPLVEAPVVLPSPELSLTLSESSIEATLPEHLSGRLLLWRELTGPTDERRYQAEGEIKHGKASIDWLARGEYRWLAFAAPEGSDDQWSEGALVGTGRVALKDDGPVPLRVELVPAAWLRLTVPISEVQRFRDLVVSTEAVPQYEPTAAKPSSANAKGLVEVRIGPLPPGRVTARFLRRDGHKTRPVEIDLRPDEVGELVLPRDDD
jgi:RNA polymerase sigma-70 factor (ECF subfamily)